MHLKMIDMAAETCLDLDSCETKTNEENNERQNQLNMLSLGRKKLMLQEGFNFQSEGEGGTLYIYKFLC